MNKIMGKMRGFYFTYVGVMGKKRKHVRDEEGSQGGVNGSSELRFWITLVKYCTKGNINVAKLGFLAIR